MNLLWYKKLRKLYSQIKYQKDKITDYDIIITVFKLIFEDNIEKFGISQNIKNALLKESREENERKMKGIKDKYEKYFFEKSESLKQFV